MARRPLGLVLYEGPSRFDNLYNIAVVATGLPGRESKNAKTGKMVQIWIIPTDGGILPGLRNGTDHAVCGECPLRPITARARRRAERLAAQVRKPKPVPICYVNQGRAPSGVSRAYHAGSYTPTSPELESRYLSGQRLRFGAWGDPAAAPSSLWHRLASLPGVRWTGYTHGHLLAPSLVSDLRSLVMLSADSAAIARDYQAQGWRTFRVRSASDPLLPGEIACPASAEAGARIQCDRCLLCDGAARLDIRRLPSIAIIDHGPGASRGPEGKGELR